MTRFSNLLILSVIILINSCEPVATFDQPQPINEKQLNVIPTTLHGYYVDSNRASTLSVDGKFIKRIYDYWINTPKDSLCASCQIIGDTLLNTKDSSKVLVLIKGDSVFQHYDGIDTLFNISKHNILKKYKGYYFLNIWHSDNSWEVRKLTLQNGVLKIGNISEKEDLEKLRNITESINDTISTRFTLTTRQFKKFIVDRGFSDQETFIKIR
jgi:hypothetical protein